MKISYFLFFLSIIISFSCSNVDEENIYQLSPMQELDLKNLADKMKDSIEIIAHRGASFYEPENSILAFKKAFELYADAIELDLFITKDDSIMVCHDINTFKLTGVNYIIPETNSAELRELDIGKGQKMPYLNEVFANCPPGKKMYLEIKWTQYSKHENDVNVDILINQIIKSKRIEDIIITCFNPNYLSRFKSKLPNLKCVWITSNLDSRSKINYTINYFKLDGISAQQEQINLDLREYLNERKMFLSSWIINDKTIARDLIYNYKVNGIVTTRPDYIRLGLN